MHICIYLSCVTLMTYMRHGLLLAMFLPDVGYFSCWPCSPLIVAYFHRRLSVNSLSLIVWSANLITWI